MRPEYYADLYRRYQTYVRQYGDKKMTETTRTEEFRVNGEALISKIKEILHEGNVRRIIIKDEKNTIYITIIFDSQFI